MADPGDPYEHADTQVLSRWRTEVDRMAGFVRRVMDERPGKSLTTHPERGTVFDFEIEEDLLEAFETCSVDGHDVYFCGTIDNKDGISDELEIGYARLLDAGIDAYVGIWLDGVDTFIDSTRVLGGGMDDAGVRSYMARYGQRFVSKLTAKEGKNGNITKVGLTFVGRQA